MDEIEQLLPSLVAAHEWIAGWDTYSGRPVGNSPEFMPLDNSLNRDIWQSLSFQCVLNRFFGRRGGNRRGGEEYALQFLYAKGNCHRTEEYMGIKNGNPLFGEDYPRCRSGVEIVVNCLPRKWGCI